MEELRQVKALLGEGADPVLDDRVFTAAQVVAPAAALAGHIEAIDYWHTGVPTWTPLNPTSPPQLPPGTDLHLAVVWRNDSNVNMRGRVETIITKPDGTQVALAAVVNQDQVALPANGWMVTFDKVTLDQAGLYQGRATLSGEAG